MVGLQEVYLEKGQFVFGRKVAADELQMSESKTYRLIKKLESLENLHIKTNNKFSIVTVVNWEVYQLEDCNTEQQFEQQMNNKRTTNEQQMNTNKNIKNIKNNNSLLEKTSGNEINENKNDTELKTSSKVKKVFSNEDKEYLLSNYLSKQITKRLNVPLQKEDILQKWSIEFERMTRLDGYNIEDIKNVLIFSQQDLFWQTNIMSASKFRKQYLVLLGKMKQAGE